MKAAWPPFTEGARTAMVLAQRLATRTGSSVVDTQHLICGVLEVDESPLLALFEARGLSIDAFRERVLREPVDVRHGPDIVFTDASKRLIEGAFDEARLARVNEVGTECLVAAVWQQPESAAARYLSDLGFDGAEVCALMRQQLGLRAAPHVETELIGLDEQPKPDPGVRTSVRGRILDRFQAAVVDGELRLREEPSDGGIGHDQSAVVAAGERVERPAKA